MLSNPVLHVGVIDWLTRTKKISEILGNQLVPGAIFIVFLITLIEVLVMRGGFKHGHAISLNAVA